MHAANEAQFLFKIIGMPLPDLRVLRFSGSEALSRLFDFRVLLVVKDPGFIPASILGREAILTLCSSASDRWVSGVIAEARLVGERGCRSIFQVRLVPTIWLMALNARCRIFQETTTEEIVRQVLVGAGIPNDRFRFALARDYDPRDYCVQYRESDLNFIQRLMEEDGMFFFFEHATDHHVLVIADDPVVHMPLLDNSVIRFVDPSGMVQVEHAVHSFDSTSRICAGKVTLNDYSYKQPDLVLLATAGCEQSSEIEVFDFPGEYTTPELGSALSKIRMEEFRVQAETAEGRGDCRALVPGSLFSLSQHPRADLNVQYLITSVNHSGEQTEALGEEASSKGGGCGKYGNTFQVIPATIGFRPARVSRRPVISSLQTAVITGPDGEEVYTDEDGRVRVLFHWAKSCETEAPDQSCWIRVAQTWAGNGFGTVFVPRVGQEVVVQFIEGDPDRPLITGCLYNGANPPPYGQKGANTQTAIRTSSTPGGGGFNELRFEDKKDSEEISLHAQRDWISRIENDSTESIGTNWSVDVGEAISFKCGKSSISLTKDGKIELKGVSIQVEASGTIETTAKGVQSLKGKPLKLNCS